MFPGQGTQYVGMFNDLLRKYPKVVVPIIDKLASMIPIDIVMKGPQYELDRTENAQPAIVAASIASWKVHYESKILRETYDQENVYVLGHSVGEYSAMIASGVVSVEDGLKMVKERGLAMSKCRYECPVSMMVLGISSDMLENTVNVIEELKIAHKSVGIAAINASTQVIVQYFQVLF